MTEQPIMICGDWHGNTAHALHMIELAKRYECKRIIQLGDFGLWDHCADGISFLDTVNCAARHAGVHIVWLDGNHENFNSLEQHTGRGPWDSDGHLLLRSHIRYSPRGCRWYWGNRYFMTVGGAVSIDRFMSHRVLGQSYWLQEQLTEQQIADITRDMAAAPRPVDYLFTHDCPTNAPFQGNLVPDPESHMHRQRMDRVGRIVRPMMWFHGHMHQKYEYEFRHNDGTALVYGLEADGQPNSWGVLYPRSRVFTWGTRMAGGGRRRDNGGKTKEPAASGTRTAGEGPRRDKYGKFIGAATEGDM